MQDKAHNDIRRLLREFGIKADETLTAYLRDSKPPAPVRVRILLEEVGQISAPHGDRLHLEIEGEVGP
jgi:hypothetical protein